MSRVAPFRRVIVEALNPIQEREVQRYASKVGRLVSKGARATTADVIRIRSAFRRFQRDALAVIPERFAMNRAAIVGVLNKTALQLDQLSRTMGGLFRNGSQLQAELTQQISDLYGETFLPLGSQAPFVGLNPAAIDIASDFSAELIDIRRGGLASRIQAAVDRELRLAALGAGPGAFNAAAAISRALAGGGPGGWTFQAERIYRTEVLRIHSILSQRMIQDFDARLPTKKRWVWSGIDRQQHQQINGQTVAAKGRFSVPTREGPSVKMRFPRDPAAPPSATINCGCYVVPWPADKTVRGARPGAAPRRARAPRVKKPTTLDGKITAARATLSGLMEAETTQFGTPSVDRLKSISKKVFAERAEKVATEYQRMLSAFPGLKKTKLRRLQFRRKQGGVHFSGNKIPGRIEVGDFERLDSGESTWKQSFNVSQPPADRSQLTGSVPTKNVSVRWTTSRKGFSVEDIFRHEFAHAYDDTVGVNPYLGIEETRAARAAAVKVNGLGKEWDKLLKKYKVRSDILTGGETYDGGVASWWGQNVSQYSTAVYDWERRTGGVEAWAELFTKVTEPGYIKGTLPADLEAFVHKAIDTKALQ